MVASVAPRELSDAEVFGAQPAAPTAARAASGAAQELSDAEVFGAAPDAQSDRGIGSVFGSALSRGWSQNVGLLTEALPALAYSVAGNEEDAQRKLAQYQARLNEIAKTNPAVIESFTKIGSLGDAVTYLAEAVGENLPSMVPGVGLGGVGMMAGRAMARSAATKAAAGMTGLTAGAVAGSAAQNIPETFADVAQETGEQRPGVALAFGGLKAGLDAIPSVMALKRAFGPAITDKIAGNILKRMGVGAAEQFASEGVTEGAQEALDIAASKYVDENKELFSTQNLERIANAGLKGGLGGAAIGAATGAIGRRGPEAPPPSDQDQGPALSDTHRQYLREMGLSDAQINEDLARAQVWAERIAARRAADTEPFRPSVEPELPTSEDISNEPSKQERRAAYRTIAGVDAETERRASEAAGIAAGEINPAAASTAARVPPPGGVFTATSVGVARPGDVGGLSGIERLTQQIGANPAAFVQRTLGIPESQFRVMPQQAQHRLLVAAMEQAQAQQPGPAYQVQDTSGQGPTSAAPAPMREARRPPYVGAAENPVARVQPTSAEIDAAGAGQRDLRQFRRYSQQAVGGSERPFPAGPDSSGLDFGNRRSWGAPRDPEAEFFERRASEMAARAKAAQQEEMQRRQEAYTRWRQADEARKRAQNEEDLRRRYSESQQYRDYEGAYREQTGQSRWGNADYSFKQGKYTPHPKPFDAEGNYPVDENGFVVSTGGGPIVFPTQKAAGRWILDHGNKRGRQVFEPANHPGVNGKFTVYQRGMTEPEQGTGPESGGPGPSASSAPSARPALAPPVGPNQTQTPGRPSPGQAEGPSPEPTAAAPGAAPVSPDAPQPAPVSPREPAAPKPKTTAKPKKGRGPASLWEFIASRGGIKDTDGELRAMGITSKRLAPGAGPLVRAGGLSYDQMREAAEEAGYIRSKDENTTTTPRDLLDAIEREMPYWTAPRGTKRKDTRIYAAEDQGEADARREARTAEEYDRREQMERAAARLGVDYNPGISDAELERLIDAKVSEMEADVSPSEPYRGSDDLMGGIPGFEPSVDRTPIGDQYVVPGAEKISDREMAERQGQKPMRSEAEQKPADEGLFDTEGRKQTDMFALGSRPSETRAGSSSGNDNVGATIQTRPETSQQRAQATESLRQILRRLAGDKVDVAVVDRIVGDDENFSDAGGYYTSDAGRRMIYIAMSSPEDMAAILRHETIHALRDLGVISAKDWRVLENQAAGWRKKYGINEAYAGLDLSQEKMNEEGIADAYAAWVSGQYKPVSVIENVFKQIRAFFEALRNWAQGNGWQTAEDVFSAIEGGAMSEAEFDRTPMTRGNAFAMSRAGMKQQANGVLDMIKNIGSVMDRLSNPLVTLPGDWRNYFEMRGMAKGEIQRIQEHLAGMRDLIGLPKAERDAALRYMTTKGAAPSMIQDPQKRAKFVEMKQEIVKLGQQLVDAGMLNEATYRTNKDSYLPRVYLKFILDEAANRRGIGTGARIGSQGYTKHKQDIPEDVRKLVYGEIDDPGFLAVRSISVVATDLAKFNLLQKVSNNPDWVAEPKKQFVEWKKKKYTPQALKAQADQLRDMVDQMPEERRAGALKMALEMEQLAKTKLKAQPEFSQDYRQIPDTSRYGALRGMWVRKEIFNDMIGTFAIPNPDPSWAEQVLGMGGWATKATQWWKFGKVVANPPSIARNLMSGMIQSNVFGRIPFAYIPMRYTQAIQEILKNGKHWQAAQKFGIKGSGFAQNESAKIERAFLAYQKQQGGTATVRNLARFKDMIAHVVDIASDGYQFIESVGKVAVIIDAMERQGLSERDAVILAEESQFDYSNVSPAVRYLRNSPIGMPFITFSSKVAPQLIKTAATRPWAFGPYLALAFGLPMLTQYMLDIDDDDLERLKKTLPKWAQETGSVYLLPFKDSAGRWHYWNAGYVLPWGQFQDAAHKAYAGKPLEAAKGMGMFGAPLVSLMTAVQTGIDPFTQRPIYNKADPPGRQWRDISLYLWSMAMPPWVGSTGFAKKLHDAALDVPIDKQGNPSVTMTQAVSSIFGISLYGLDPDVNRQKNLAQMKYEIDEIKRRRGSIAKDARLKPADKKAYLDEINTHIAEKAKAMAEYARETNVNPKLRVPAAR